MSDSAGTPKIKKFVKTCLVPPQRWIEIAHNLHSREVYVLALDVRTSQAVPVSVAVLTPTTIRVGIHPSYDAVAIRLVVLT
jgi:hypothetical protein